MPRQKKLLRHLKEGRKKSSVGSYETLSKGDNTLPHIEDQEEAGGDQEPEDYYIMIVYDKILLQILEIFKNVMEKKVSDMR